VNGHGRFYFVTMNPTLSPILSASINHLLAQEPWAREKLAAHAGKVVCIDAGALKIRMRATADGMVESNHDDQTANVTLYVQLSDLPMIMKNRERAFSYVKLEGDADFANAISQVSQNLRWEVEEDLSKWVGDIAATRIVTGAKAVLETAKSTQQSLGENIAEYLVEENPMLMRPQPVADFGDEVSKLRDDVERLSKRIEKLEGRLQ
jgi:ubiquinone biosynthesis protein UbiJ